ncbi:MAG: DUF2807 domain-containing protein [Bacteroidetes bacterium]|nr:MAG: DUF2807 domain-containing protein [Bacteroidota bacterium]
MKKSVILLTGILVSVILGSCIFTGSIEGNGKVVEETRDLRDFDKISVTRGMNVYISQGPVQKVVVKADENLLEVIETSVSDGTLKVSCNRGIRKAVSNKVLVTVPDIDLVKATAGSNVFAEDTLNVKVLEIRSTAGSNVKLILKSEELNVSAVAGSNIFLNGTSESFTAKANSGSNIKAGDMRAITCDLKASSGANIWINAQKELSAGVSSGANVFYYGNPEATNIEKSSGGNVIKN